MSLNIGKETLVGRILDFNDRNNRFQIFKEGKDKGIDLYYDSDYKYNIVVQVKHYRKTSFSSWGSNNIRGV